MSACEGKERLITNDINKSGLKINFIECPGWIVLVLFKVTHALLDFNQKISVTYFGEPNFGSHYPEFDDLHVLGFLSQ